jgi:hypothetical protein
MKQRIGLILLFAPLLFPLGLILGTMFISDPLTIVITLVLLGWMGLCVWLLTS